VFSLLNIEKELHMYNYNDPSIKLIAQEYLRILQESHTRERLEKLSKEELEKLKDEYKQKIETIKDEDKVEDHKKEYGMIIDILKSK
jgi:predicted AlkP superfamily phosphohydrolase/phosphomutase